MVEESRYVRSACTTRFRPIGAGRPYHFVATWPVGTFIENIAVMADGSFVISVHNRCEILHVSRAGASTRLVSLPFSPAGLVATSDGVFAVAGKPGQSPHRLFKVGLDGSVEERMQVPDTMFLNGLTPARPGRAYTVDSILGVVIELDFDGTSSRIVLRDERLTKCSPDLMVPGANGIKVGDGALFITSTDRALVLRAELGPDGLTGQLSTLAEHLRGDDLALDEVGNLYIANHIHNTLIRLRPNGERIAIAGPDQGMAGSTACVFTSDDPGGLYVTATGASPCRSTAWCRRPSWSASRRTCVDVQLPSSPDVAVRFGKHGRDRLAVASNGDAGPRSKTLSNGLFSLR